MAPKPCVIAVVDLQAQPAAISRAALAWSRQYQATLLLVAILEYDTLRQESALLEQLQRHAATLGATTACCQVLSGPPTQALAALAIGQGATLILADLATARLLQNSWFPWQQPVTPLPCPLQVIELPLRFTLLTHLAGFLRTLRGKLAPAALHADPTSHTPDHLPF
ncbi:MAG: hypothetical protein HQL95_13940 [Magnetococcales bacterium]|nr:hypothetical protein [Magnetococcales bacterium]